MGASGSSSISSRISASSSTSDARLPLGRRIVGAVRLTHPFPSILDGLVSGGAAVAAGATASTSLRLGLAMVALQLGIGALNDVVDAPRDAGHKPGKPIPSGLVSPSSGRLIALIAFGIGLVLAFLSGVAVSGLAAVAIAIGALYDLRLKGTPWSWLPFALGIPLLPVFGWLGATGELPAFFGILMPVAVAAGAGLAIANSLVDVDRDRDAGVSSIAVALGDDRAGAILIVVFGAIAIAAAVSAIVIRGDAIAAAGLALLASLPVVAAALARSHGPVGRERAWRIEACGLALLALAWIRVVL